MNARITPSIESQIVLDLEVPFVAAVSSRGQDTWFSATGPGFESPYRYHIPTNKRSVSCEDIRGGVSVVGEQLIGWYLKKT